MDPIIRRFKPTENEGNRRFTESNEVPSSASFPASVLSHSYATIAERIGNNKFSC